MARYVDQGARVTIAIATNGEVGGPGDDPIAITAIRKREAEASARLLGASLIWMGFQDEMLFNTREVREAFIDAYRHARPDAVFIHSTEDYHPDHRIAGQVALDARIPAAVPLVKTSLPALEKIPHLFIMDTLAGVNFEPEYLIDISSQQTLKEELLRSHASQIEWMTICYGDDYIADSRKQSALRASGTEWKYVEAFRSVRTYPVTGGPELLPEGWRPAPEKS
jgi:LmbE family N-acetylglucosaminyl deacetylase